MNTVDLNSRSVIYGDKMFARITKNGHTLGNFVSETVSSISELMKEIINMFKGTRGLIVVHIRNYNRGWNEERPVMLRGV